MLPKTKLLGKRVIKTGLLLLLLVEIYGLISPFCYCRVCSRCGAREDTFVVHEMFTDVVVFTHSSVSETKLSRILRSTGLVASHEHQWLFAHGAGNGVMCAIGPGRHVFQNIDSAEVHRLFFAVHQYGNPLLSSKLLDLVLDPDCSFEVKALGQTMPGAGFANTNEFNAWAAEHIPPFDESIELRRRKPKY